MGQAGALVEAASLDADELALLHTNLSLKLKTLEAFNTEIVDLTPEAQLEEDIGRADEYSEKIQRALLQIKKVMKPPQATPARGLPSGTTGMPPSSPRRESPIHHSAPHMRTTGDDTVASGKVKLPKISLAHFKGGPIYWTAFWDSYHKLWSISTHQIQVPYEYKYP